MPISITAIDRINGAQCDHVIVTLNDEGETRTFETSFGQVDNFFENLSAADQKRVLVTLWTRYRRAQGRAVVGVNIA